MAPGSTAWSIATPGCPFHCTFCQNWDIAQGPRLGLHRHPPTWRRTPSSATPSQPGAGSIAYTYVEPTVFLEFALDVGRMAQAAGLRNLWITDGYATREAVGLLAAVMDAANVDLKSFDDAFYRRLCGARLAPVLDAIVAMRDAGIWLEITTLVIPGRNDDETRLRAIARWIVAHARRRDAVARQPLPPRLPAARRPADAVGDARAGGRHRARRPGSPTSTSATRPSCGSEDTRCAGCGIVVIERRGWAARNLLHRDGTCPACGQAARRPRSRRAWPR